MYLKRIEIFGFKSFALKTKLEFEAGLTAIVGPNGCGKTNLSEAIKWVLGEQSTRSLRCARMEDIIFNGSQSRPPLSFAEVHLVIDNQDGVAPINYSEVSVARRLYRSGESEYYLNKTQCRLKDIRDLFLDTGLGSQSYSLMEQGKVEFILQAKPEERRSLFEEAAGIAKYKVRKEEALSKLEKVEFDLLRLNDALTLLNEQIHSLEQSVRKVRQYQKYQEELKTLEIIMLLEQLKNLEKETEALTTGSKEVIQDYETFSNLIQNLETNLSGYENELAKKKEKINLYQNNLHQIETDLIRAEDRITLAEEKIKESTLQSKIQREENTKNQEILQNLKENLDKLSQEKVTLEKEIISLKEKLKEKENFLNEITKKIKQRTHSLEEKRTKIFQIVHRKAQVKNEIVRLQTQESNLENEKKQLNSELLSLKGKKEKISTEINLLNEKLVQQEKEIKTLKEKKINLESELVKKKNLYRDLLNQLQKCHEEITHYKARLSSMQELAEKQKISQSAIQAVLSLGLTGISGPISKIIKVPSENEKFVEKVLGEKLNFLVSETQEIAEKAIQYLRENDKGWIGFFILEKIPEKLPPLFKLPKTKNLLEIIHYEPEYKNLMHFLFSTVYFHSSIIYSEAIIQGGSKTKEISLLSMEQEIKKLEENLNKLELLSKQLSVDKERGEKEIIDWENELNKVNLSIHENQILQTELLKENEKKKDENSLTLEEIKVVTWEIDQREKGILEKNQQTQEQEKLHQDIETEEKNLQNEIQSLEKEILNLKDEETKFNKDSTELKISFSTSEQHYRGIVIENEKITKEIKNLEKIIAEKKEKITSLDEILTSEKDILEKEKEKINLYKQRKEEIEKNLLQLTEEGQKLEEKISADKEKTNSLKQKFKEIEEKKKDTDFAFQKINLEKNHLKIRLKDEFKLTLEEAEEKYGKFFAPGGLPQQLETTEGRQIQIDRLKRRIESLGAVNLAAQEEYENLKARLNFLLAQEEDLKKAKEDLHQLINKINISTRESFQKTFEQVRKNFQQTFHFLFEGGEADIILTDEQNLLETGIDIVAQPAGKKLQNISLLSGGEKALTAIALLFAFFLVKPAPFCLLDEVDAALDDANVSRFVRLVKDFAQKTQFIIITHNKRTIEIADLLYGVTMEEFGVSKIISVKFQKAVVPVPA